MTKTKLHDVNVTLMFSMAQYDMVAEAYISAMEKRAAKVSDLHQIASVASFFVSRIDVDVMVDAMLDKLNTFEANLLKGKISITNAKLAYQHFKEMFGGPRVDFITA